MRRGWFVARFLLALSSTLIAGCDDGGGGNTVELGDPADVGENRNDPVDENAVTPVEKHGALQVIGTQLSDANGDAVQLKGVSSMWLNWEEDGYAENLDALKWLRTNWDLTVVRAAMGVAPNGAYLSDPEKAKMQVSTIVDHAIEAGVYVIIDWHDHDAHEHTEQAVQFFSEMSAKYAGVPNVLYETFNEPMAVAWPVVKEYHEATVAAIRANDPSAIVILGTPTWSQDVDFAAADPVEGTNLMYTLHYYACDHGGYLRVKGDKALGMGAALFITEWGATPADGGTDGTTICVNDAQQWDDWSNARKISWAAWKLDNCGTDTSCLLTQNAPLGGPWTDEYLYGHARYVRGRMQVKSEE